MLAGQRPIGDDEQRTVEFHEIISYLLIISTVDITKVSHALCTGIIA